MDLFFGWDVNFHLFPRIDNDEAVWNGVILAHPIKNKKALWTLIKAYAEVGLMLEPRPRSINWDWIKSLADFHLSNG